MKHILRMHPRPFQNIKNGTKIIEIRLYDEKRQKIQLGDILEFQLRPDLEERLQTRVTGLLRYPKFENLFDDIPASWCNYDESEKEYLRTSMYEYYTPEQEEENGVIGIRIELITD